MLNHLDKSHIFLILSNLFGIIKLAIFSTISLMYPILHTNMWHVDNEIQPLQQIRLVCHLNQIILLKFHLN